jgi:transcription-repair coupling factor (superfamily II helicase)
MDRLVCGDVGYGKTEVAMRAAYRLVLEGKQVAVLVPTTVLAYQHYENFRSRFRNTGARVEMVSRLRSNADIKKAIEGLERGSVDVIVGTHRLLSADVKFKDLGLVVIDEEHRFGVVHKERLKKLCASVHVLSMTATPIPRTLNMALAGIKEISVISTPPPDRMSVRTFVCRATPEVVAEAISNELARDGQVFFVHNRIETLFGKADELKQLLPKVRMEVAHGQMDGEELEKKMLAFYRGEAQVLLSTAIVESGIDVPRANTIIIDQAQNFGLAQLYQLRGRVGRADRRAYCYLLIPSETGLAADAKQRLQVIQRYSELGSGFGVASHDLEIRGAGDLLGKEQSGHLTAVGVDMYFELLEEAVEELRGRKREAEVEPEITMKIAAYFPSDYLPDVAERIAVYRKLSSVKSEDEVAAIEQEIRDRFGAPPPEVANLLGLMTLKLYLKRLHVVRMSCGPKKTALQFAPTTPASPEKLVALIQKGKGKFQITPDQKLVFPAEANDWRSQLDGVLSLSRELGVA